MSTASKKWIIAAVADLLLLSAGCVVAFSLWAADVHPNEYYLWSADVLAIVDLCFFGLFVIIEIISFYKISDSTWHTIFIAVSLLLHHLTGIDFMHVLFDETETLLTQLAEPLHFLFYELSAASVLCFWNYTYRLSASRRTVLLFSVWGAVCFAGYIPLCLIGLGIIPYALFTLSLAGMIVVVYRRVGMRERVDAAFYTTQALYCSLAGSELAVNACAAAGFLPYGVPSFQAIPSILAFLSVYAAFAMRTDRAALRASEYKLRYERMKARALKEQIKPHFVFNTLAAIQSLYRVSPSDGDRAVTLLSQHLRTNIEATDTDFIPFERELDNVQVLVDLENMRLGKQVKIVYDIDCVDFRVPVLSLQPYIENAIKYSKVNEKEDGFIRISTRLSGEDVLLSVTDNGVGFDLHSVKRTSCGIRNSSERFSMLMGVTPHIKTSPGGGTSVIIQIKKQFRDPKLAEGGADGEET